MTIIWWQGKKKVLLTSQFTFCDVTNISTYLCHHASPSDEVSSSFLLATSFHFHLHNCFQKTIKMRILLVLIMPEGFKSLSHICAHWWRNVVIDARLIVPVFVIVVIGEVSNLAGSLYACRSAAKTINWLNRKSMSCCVVLGNEGLLGRD